MALIGKIRQNMWLVIVLLAVALAGFIIMDMQSASNRGGLGSRTSIGKVAGEKIDYMDFQRAESALYGGSQDVYGRKNSLWNYFVEKAIVDDVANSSGIGIGADELSELEFGTNLSPIVQSYYRNPQTGQVDRAQLNEIKKAIDEGTVTNPEFAARFNELRKQVIKSQKQTKLNNLVAKAMYTPTWMAEAMDKVNNEVASFDYVKVPFDVIGDAEVTLTDDDYAAYIKDHATKYTNKEEVRNVSYIVYDVVASTEDTVKIKDEITSLAANFATAENDSLFCVTNEGFYSNNYVNKDDLTGTLKDVVSGLEIGAVYGPYLENNAYIVAKLIGKKVMADSAKAGHILRSVANGDVMQLMEATRYIDSLKAAITSGVTSFADAATLNSQDPGSAAKAGDLGTFAPGAMVPQFNDAVFNGKEGGLYTVTTQFGVHLIKVNKLIFKSNELKYNLAYLAQPIIPSETTQNAQLDKVMAILENAKSFDDVLKAKSADVTVETAGGLKANDYTFATLGSGQTSRDIVKWAFEGDTNVGDVSSVAYTYVDEANYVDSKYVIAGLKSIDKPGVATVESIKTTIEPLVRNAKKAEAIKAKINGTDLDAIALTFGQTRAVAENVSFGRPSIPDAGYEPTVVGKAFALTEGAYSGVITGNSGVYVLKLNSKIPALTSQGSLSQKMALTQAARSQVNGRLMEALKKINKVEDNRATFF